MNAALGERPGKGPRVPRADAGANKKLAKAGLDQKRPGKKPNKGPKPPQENAGANKKQAKVKAKEKQANAMPDNCRLAARLREETAELLALLPAARKAAAGGPAGGEAALDGMARAAYRVLRIAENMDACAALAAGAVKASPICITALAAAYVNGAAGVCRTAVFQPAWPREPLWSPGCARLFAAALGNLLANAVQYGGERPVISVGAQTCGAMLLFTVADSGDGSDAGNGTEYSAQNSLGYGAGYGAEDGAGDSIRDGMRDRAKYSAEDGAGNSMEYGMEEEAEYGTGKEGIRKSAVCAMSPQKAEGLGLAVARQYAAAFGGQLLADSAPGRGARFTLCLPLCAPGTPTAPPDYMADRFSPLYVQLAPVCDLPL